MKLGMTYGMIQWSKNALDTVLEVNLANGIAPVSLEWR